jgi:hypothetical protein
MAVNKYRNIPVVVDGRRFASKREAKRYGELRMLERYGIIRDLVCQPSYRLEVNGEHICVYRADFKYFDTQHNCEVVEDAKGVRTQSYRIKARLMRAVLGIVVREV